MKQATQSDRPWTFVFDIAKRLLSEVSSVNTETLEGLMEIPPDPKLGDIATTVAFHLAKTLKKNPMEIANRLTEKLQELIAAEPLLDRAENKGPYINIFIDRGKFTKFVLQSVVSKGESYGKTDIFRGRTALIEFPAVNPSKPWHIGHARNAVIGDTLSNILETTGHDVLRIDYINDLGLQIAQLVWKLQKGNDQGEDIEEKYDHFLGRLYVEVQEAFGSDKKVEEEIRQVARDLEDRSSDAAAISEDMVTKCVRAQCQTAYRLGIYHHLQAWESTIAHSGLLDFAKRKMLEHEHIFIPEEGNKAGCIVAKLDEIEGFEDMKDPYKVLFRSDGTRTYTGADVAFQMWKFGLVDDPFKYGVFEMQPNNVEVIRTRIDGNDWDIGTIDVVFNVIATRQAHPQRLIYEILDLLGYKEQCQNSHHVAYEFVTLEDEDFSGRKGTWVGYSTDDVLDKAKELAKTEVEKRNPDESEEFKEKTAEEVGVGAIRYMLLKASPERKITFRWEEALDFNGDAAPYLQYSHARAQRILEKAGNQDNDPQGLEVLSSDHEFELIKSIAKLPDVILDVAMGLKKNVWGTSFISNRITAYCYNLATLFSKFYDSCPVLKANPTERAARIQLVRVFKRSIQNCLKVLGIPAVERM